MMESNEELGGDDQGDWADYVGRANCNCNVAMHLATKGWSFVVAYGVGALQPINLGLEGAHSTSKFNQDGEDLAKDGKQVLEMTKLLVEKTRRCYGVQVNAGRREVENEVAKRCCWT